MSRRQRRLDALTLLACLPVALAILIGLFQLAGTDPVPGDRYRVQAVVPTSDALSPPAEVRIDGIKVGTVADIAEHGNEGRTSLLLLDLDEEHAPVFRDATVRIRLRTLVGENYVELDPGKPSSGQLPDGGTLAIGRAEEYVASDDVLKTFDAKHRKHLSGQLRELGSALGGRGGDMNRMLEATAALTRDASPLVARLARQRHQVGELVDHVGSTMQALGDRTAAIRTYARHSTTALSALEQRDEAVERMLDELPSTLAQARATSGTLAQLSGRTTPVLRDLRVGLQRLDPVVERLGPAAQRTQATMAALGRFARRGTPALTTLRRFSRAGAPALPRLEELLRHYNPFAGYFTEQRRELGAFLGNMRGISTATDESGNLARIGAVVSPSTVAAFTPEMRKMYDRLRDVGLLRETLGPHFVNPYPKPGEIDEPSRMGDYPRLHPEPAGGG